MLETLIVYGLVLLFFVLLAVFVGVVLSSHPYSAPEPAQHPEKVTRTQISKDAGNGISYGIIALLLLLFCVITVLDQRESTLR